MIIEMKIKLVILSSFFICLAALFNAGQDSISHHYNTSFAKALDLNEQFWNPSISWKNKYVDRDPSKERRKIDLLLFKFDVPAAFTDGWHLLKTASIFFLILSPVFLFPGRWKMKLAYFVILSVCWNVTFNIFYSIKY
jgi:hypothetical protein